MVETKKSSGVSGLLLDGLREELADLEHQQWESWTKYIVNKIFEDSSYNDKIILRNLGKVHRNWSDQWKPYKELTEKQKDMDRVWADKTLKFVERRVTEFLEAKRKELKEKIKDRKSSWNSACNILKSEWMDKAFDIALKEVDEVLSQEG